MENEIEVAKALLEKEERSLSGWAKDVLRNFITNRVSGEERVENYDGVKRIFACYDFSRQFC